MLPLIALFLLSACFFVPRIAYAEWTPLISVSDFTGIKTDVLATAGGIISIFLIIAGLAILIRSFGGR